MTFYIYRDRLGIFTLTDAGDNYLLFLTEGEAIDAAVRIAQESNSTYRINYWKPGQ